MKQKADLAKDEDKAKHEEMDAVGKKHVEKEGVKVNIFNFLTWAFFKCPEKFE